ncbi:MAG: hypothetical protein ACOZAP_08140 [Pseudomonadota bacterium]|jgi:chromosome segregation ATPase
MENLSTSIMIGAALAASFQTSITSAQRKLHSIGEAINDLSSKKAAFKPLEKAEADLDEARAKLVEARRAVLELKKAMRDSPSPAVQKALDEATEASGRLAKTVEKKQAKLRETRSALEASGDATAQHTGPRSPSLALRWRAPSSSTNEWARSSPFPARAGMNRSWHLWGSFEK